MNWKDFWLGFSCGAFAAVTILIIAAQVLDVK